MIYELAFTKEAGETFDLIIEQLLDQWGITTVLKFQELTSINLEKIKENPFLYQIIDQNFNIRRCVMHANCSVLYHVFETQIQIVCFWDNRQNPILG